LSRDQERPHISHVVLLTLALAAPWCRAAPPVALRDGTVGLDVDSNTGAIMAITDLPSGTVLAPPAGLAENYRLVLRGPDMSTSTILGKDQHVSSCRVGDAKLTISWDGPLTDTAGVAHDLGVRMDVTVADGFLTFELRVDNRAEGKLVETWYPLVGGLPHFGAPDKPSDGSLWVPTSTPWEKPIALPFGDAAFGYPGQMNMSFCCIQSKSAGRSVYFASHDLVARYKTYRFAETSGPGGTDVAACIQHLPFTPPGGAFDGSPVVVGFVPGGWREAAQVYRRWFIDTFGIPVPADDWIRRQSFFLMTMFMLPEGTINYTFKDIPQWARSAKEHGLGAVQISGWQQGGHDNGYPDYTPDRRLGTWQELEEGIRACHEMGLKVYFFANYQPMMVDSEWYKRDLAKYREMAPDGGYTWMAGWGMGTLWARMGHPKLMTWADCGFPEFRKIIVDQFAKLARIGADGVHVDKVYPSAIDYNPDIPMSPDTSTWEGTILLTKEIMQECRRHNPDWAMSFECNWDRLIQFGGATWWVGNQLITRKVFPENAETLGLYQAYDHLGVNNAVRDGHIVMVAPENFCRSLDWPPFRGLADYIKEVKRIRDSLQDTVFFGEVLGASQVTLKGGAPDGVQYNVFRNRIDGRRVCIVTNSRMEERRLTFSRFEGASGDTVRIHTPYVGSRVVRLPAEIVVPAERLVFVEEIGGAR